MPVIKYAQLQFGLSKEFKTGAGKSPGFRRYGFAQFSNAGYAGDLMPITFKNQLLIPDVAEADTIDVYTDDLNGWVGSLLKADAPSYDVKTTAGVINLAKQLVAGITNGVTAPSSYQNNISPQSWTVPIPDGSGGATSQTTAEGNILRDSVKPTFTLTFWSTALAFASEIAQRQVLANMAATNDSVLDFTGETTITPSSGVPNRVQLTMTTPGSHENVNFGNTGATMYGWYAWQYNEYYGKLHYLNAPQIATVPELPIATGLWVMLKGGVHASGEIWYNPYGLQSMFSSLGEINLLAGKLAGLGL